MINSSPHPRNDESLAPQSSGHPREDHLHRLPLNEASNLPCCSINPANIESAKHVLGTERLGISYRNVLVQLSQAPWTFFESIDFNSAALTIKLLEFNPDLARKYEEKIQSEGDLSRLLASVPLLSRPLPSMQFLESVGEVNQIVQDMHEAGLLQIEHCRPDKIITGDRVNPIVVGARSSRISVTDLGNLALRT